MDLIQRVGTVQLTLCYIVLRYIVLRYIMSSRAFYESSCAIIDGDRLTDLVLSEKSEENDWLLRRLLDVNGFNQETYETVQRLYGPRTPNEWNVLLTKNCYEFTPIEFFIANESLDVRGFPSMMEFVLFHGMHDTEDKMRLLERLIAHGGNVNEQEPVRGDSLLRSYLRRIRSRLEIHAISGKAEARILIPYLLEKGADPRLASHTGETALDLARTWPGKSHPRSFKDWILLELERSL